MAKIRVEGLDELIIDMESAAMMPDEVYLAMVDAKADVFEPRLKSAAESMLSGPRSKGITAKSIKRRNRRKTKYGAKIEVFPDGDRPGGGNKKKGKNTRRIAEVAFINEYGARGVPPRPFMRATAETSADATAAAAYDVFDKFLKSKNL